MTTFGIKSLILSPRSLVFRLVLLTTMPLHVFFIPPGWCDSVQPLQLIDNSVGLSQVVDLNSRGEVLGTKEVEIRGLGLGQEPFFQRGANESKIEFPRGFTNLEPQALSDTGVVVGYVSRVIGHPDGSLRAFAWDTATATHAHLELPDGMKGSVALDVSSDASVISGYLTGSNPARMLPCIWQADGRSWNCTPLSTLHDYNPILVGSRVVVSDNGSKVAACLTVEVIPGEIPLYHNALFLWQRTEAGRWQRSSLRDGSVKISNINNHGMIVGDQNVKGYQRAFVYDPASGFSMPDLLEGDESSRALDVNNGGVVVGFSDDPYGPEGGPTAFVWRSGEITPVNFPVETVFSSATSINDHGRIGGYLILTEEDDQPDRAVSFTLLPTE